MRIGILFNFVAAVMFGSSVYLASTARNAVALEQPSPAAVTQIEKGRELYKYWCATCHGAGVGAEGRAQLPGTAALQQKYRGNPPALLEARTDLTPEVVSVFVRNGISVMPFFRKTEISDEELAAIGAYLSRSGPRSGN